MLLAIAVSFAACSKDDDDDDQNGNGPPSNAADTVAVDNRVAYFKFDGDVTDEEGHQTTSEGVNYTFNRHSQANSAYTGSETAYIHIANPENLRMTSMTFSMWLRAEQLPAETNFILTFIDPAIDWNAGYALWQEGSLRGDTLRYKAVTRHQDSDMYGWMDTDAGVLRDVFFPSQKWYHFVFAYDGETSIRDIYMDGARVARDTLIAGETPLGLVTVPETATDFYIGRNPNESQTWIHNYNGDLDDLRIFNIALTEQQVQRIYDAEKPE